MKTANHRIILKQAEILKALGQPTRLRICEMLRKGERCVCNIYPFVDQRQANVSRHLNLMKRIGILDSRQEGLHVVYRIKSPQVLNIVDQASSMVQEEVAQYQKALSGDFVPKIPCNLND